MKVLVNEHPLSIRPERAEDKQAIWYLNAEAFETDAEADLVDLLRQSDCGYTSFVADLEGEIVGHVLFTPVALDGSREVKIWGLAPLAVKFDYQHQGIGQALTKAGLAYCKEQGVNAVVLLGSPGYYHRFGFKTAKNYGLTSEFEAPEEAFMVLELKEGSLKNCTGLVHFHALFNEVGH